LTNVLAPLIIYIRVNLTIEDLQTLLAISLEKLRSSKFQGLKELLPPGYEIQVTLRDKKHRKKRRDASAENWNPADGEILISFQPVEIEQEHSDAVLPTDNGIPELVRELDKAESRPGYSFVALKWFRDTVMPAVRPEWEEPEVRGELLRSLIASGFAVTRKIPNPKSPTFPVTALQLNRSNLTVAAILARKPVSEPDFNPVPIRGQSLSETILRERR
jgi:hypothetical protein